MTDITIRAAVPADSSRLHSLIDASVRGLHGRDYTDEQIEAALATVYGVDTQLIEDGTYFVAVADGGGVVGCGGWSKRATLHGSDRWTDREDRLVDPQIDAARIRAFFVHPDWTRRGIGTRILALCESAARAAGFRRFEISATLTGVALYAANGYATAGRSEIPLRAGLALPIVRMVKPALAERDATASARLT